jgi:hypothetical protein
VIFEAAAGLFGQFTVERWMLRQMVFLPVGLGDSVGSQASGKTLKRSIFRHFATCKQHEAVL